MKKTVLLFMALISIAFFASQVQAQNAWINEFHYDNSSTDVGEFIEVVIENSGSYTLSQMRVDLYNGNGGVIYDFKTLDEFTEGATSGNFTFFHIVFPSNGIQNGPDGFALSYSEVLIPGQFISYEGTVDATEGVANSLTSTDIGVSEGSGTPIGESLQLSGTGSQYSDFSWQSPATETPGALNNSQTFGTAAPPTKLAVTLINGGDSPIAGIPFEVDVQAQDNSSNPANVTSNVIVSLTLATGSGILGGNLTGTILTGESSVTISGVTYDTGETGVSITASGGGLIAGTSATFEVIAPVNVSTIGTLRGSPQGVVYNLTGEVWLTFQQEFRNQKYIQDATAAILIDDAPNGNFNPGIISTVYDIGDGIMGIVGELSEYNNMMQFIPLADPGVASSNGNFPTPEVITIDDLNDSFDDYEAELVQLLDVTFADADGDTTFTNGEVYPISDLSKALGHFRTTFYDVDYIGTIIPGSADIVVLPNARDTINIVTCRSLADIVPGLNQATHLAVIEVNGGADPYENTDFNVVVELQESGGETAIYDEDVDFDLTTDHLSVDFTVSSTLSGTIISGTTQVTVSGVQMAPAGTGVTITAEHDVLFGGLTSVESDPFDVVEFVIPEIIITEIMNNPSAVYDSDGEWFEVYNNSAIPVDMTGWLMTDSLNDYHTIVGPLTVPAYGFAVLGNNADDVTNGGYFCDYEFPGNFYLGNGSDKLILVLPGGVTEIDRVEWDDGATFPDPNGASMVYTGLKSEDNNDGTLWATSVLREDTYTGTEGDLGSPGTDGNDQIFSQGFGLDLKVFLEGPYDIDTDEMTSDLFIPYNQPFNVPGAIWEYGGTDAAPSIAGAVTTDWILVELRNGGVQGTGIVFPAFVEVDGQVCSYNGSRRLNIKDDIYDNLQIVIWQRNHIGIMSSTGFNPMNGNVYDYDFTTGSDKVVGGTAGYKQLEPDVWGMVAGDVTADGIVDDLDKDNGWYIEAGLAGYLGGDLNLDKQSNNQDKNDYWLINNDLYSTQVP